MEKKIGLKWVNNAKHEKWNTEWNEINGKLKEIKRDYRSWKEENKCRKDETVINRQRGGYTLLTHGYLMEGLPMPECMLCNSHAMTLKHLSNDCFNLASLRLIF